MVLFVHFIMIIDPLPILYLCDIMEHSFTLVHNYDVVNSLMSYNVQSTYNCGVQMIR